MYLRWISFCALCLLLSCGQHDGYGELEPGVKYKLISPGEEDEGPGIGQYVSYRIAVYDGNEKLIYHTKKRGVDKDEYFLYTHDKTGAIQRNINKFSEGDSISFKLELAAFEEQFPFVQLEVKQETYRVQFKINYFEDVAERENRLSALGSHAVLQEEGKIADFIASRKDSVIFEKWNNMYLHVLEKGNISVKKGSRMALLYSAYFLNGEEFDNTIDGDSLFYTFGDQGQVIEGLKLLASYLGIGSKCKVVIPSKLAFGDGGSTGKVIPPSTPLFYVLEIKDANHSK